jgi:RimJ/RimL family protein N-acetyltransferase
VNLPTLIIRPYRSDEFERACEIRELTTPESRERMKMSVESSGSWGDHYMHLAIEFNQQLAGDIQLRHCKYTMPPGAADLGIEIDSKLRGQGLASAALVLVADKLFTEGFHRISGSTAESNIAMQKAFAKAGWQEEGVMRNLFVENNKGIDYITYAITHVAQK